MLIPVIYRDNKYDYVKDFMLELLIDLDEIIKFKRSSGWVTIGIDPIRQKKLDSIYDGVERRGRNTLAMAANS